MAEGAEDAVKLADYMQAKSLGFRVRGYGFKGLELRIRV